MKRTTIIALFTLMLALPAFAQRDERAARPEPTLTVNGNGEVRVAPDEATVRLGVTRQADTAQQAQAQVNEVAARILEAITRLGVNRDQVQTSAIQLYPVYAPQRPEREEEPRIVAYRATYIISARLENLALVGQVIDAGLGAGANQLEGVQFGLHNDQAARENALREAVREARQKARVLAEALEVRLGTVLTVQEGGVSINPPPFAGGAVFARAEAANTPIAPGQVTVNAGVSIQYRITAR